jgi:hypothetical protein
MNRIIFIFAPPHIITQAASSAWPTTSSQVNTSLAHEKALGNTLDLFLVTRMKY